MSTSKTLNSLKILVVLVAICIVGGFGTCTVGLVGVHYFGPKPVKLSHKVSVDELIEKCGTIESKGLNSVNWKRPKCVLGGKHLNVIFNQKTRKLMEWKIKFNDNTSEAIEINLRLPEKISLPELKERCGTPSKESQHYAKWEHPNCEVIKQLEVAFNSKTGLALAARKISLDNKVSVIQVKAAKGISFKWP